MWGREKMAMRQVMTKIAVVLAAGLTLWGFPGQAKAWWDCGLLGVPSWCCPWDCGCWYLGIRPGPIRRLLFGPYRWYWTPAPCCWVACWPECCFVECTFIPTESEKPREQGVPKEPAPADTSPQGVTPEESGTSPTRPGPVGESFNLPSPPAGEPQARKEEQNPVAPDATEIVLVVPTDARVKINGLLTRSQGGFRRYVSYGLEPGKQYRYEIEVELIRGGKVLRHSETVLLAGGKRVELAVWVPADMSRLLASLR